MNIMLSGPWLDRDLMPHFAETIEAAGHHITERWWEHPDSEDENVLTELAGRDLFGVMWADAVVVINSRASEGKAVELGIAITMCTPVVVVGKRTNIFHYLPGVLVADSVVEALDLL